jgi:hypothetical protein
LRKGAVTSESVLRVVYPLGEKDLLRGMRGSRKASSLKNKIVQVQR